MRQELQMEIGAIGADTRSGATAIVERAVAVLQRAAREGEALDAVGDALCRAQPSMAALRVLTTLARRASDPHAAIDAFAARLAHTPRLIARHAVALLRLRRASGAVRLVTCSRSAAVEQTIRALAADIEVSVACAEGRPALEGRDLAASLAAAGIDVTLYTDAGIATAIRAAEALLVGADAIGPDRFINKVGTGALAALASVEGVPTYVLAGREKILPAQEFTQIRLVAGPGAEVSADLPDGVVVANPYFEEVRSTLASAFVTDAGTVPAEAIPGLAII